MAISDLIQGPAGSNLLDSSGNFSNDREETFCNKVIEKMEKGNSNGDVFPFSKTLGVSFPQGSGPNNLLKPKPFKQTQESKDKILDPQQKFRQQMVRPIVGPILKTLNLPGQASLFPAFDPTSIFSTLKISDISLFTADIAIAIPTIGTPAFPLAIEDLSKKYNIGLPELTSAFGVFSSLIPPPLPPIPSIPSFEKPNLPDFALGNVVNFSTSIMKLPVELVNPTVVLSTMTNFLPFPTPEKIITAISLPVEKILVTIPTQSGLLPQPSPLMSAYILTLFEYIILAISSFYIGITLGTGGIIRELKSFFDI